MAAAANAALTYDEWRERISRDLGVLVVDDEGRRRCAREHGLAARLTREQAEALFLKNAIVRPRGEIVIGS